MLKKRDIIFLLLFFWIVSIVLDILYFSTSAFPGKEDIWFKIFYYTLRNIAEFIFVMVGFLAGMMFLKYLEKKKEKLYNEKHKSE